MAKYKAYPEYKDSGVEWLGMIPTEWKISHFKWLTNDGKSFASGPFSSSIGSKFYQEYGVPVIRGNNLSINGEKPFFKDSGYVYLDDAKADELSNAEVIAGDLVFTARGTVGQVGLIPADSTLSWNRAILSANQLRYRTDLRKYNSSYLWYQFSSWFIRTQITLSSDSVAQPNLNLGSLKALNIIVPPLMVQKAIADFLDHETAKIDNLIEKQQQLIELLKEKRQAVISHAVTKGLNPDVSMKDSGVEWLGKVPAHWGVMPVKYVCALIKDGTHLPPPRVENGIPLLSVRNIIGGVFQFRDDDSQISHKDYKSLCSSFIPKKDDVLLAIVGATLGKVALVPEMDSFHIQRSLGVFRTNKLIHPQHLSYIFESKDFQNLLWENAGFSAQPGIYLGTLSNFCVPVPPVTEQLKISEFITATVDKLDLLITQASKLIGLIQERRTALISAAVTGKIDVRDWVAPDTQDVEEPQEATA